MPPCLGNIKGKKENETEQKNYNRFWILLILFIIDRRKKTRKNSAEYYLIP